MGLWRFREAANDLYRVPAKLPVVSYRVLCETVKDFVARVGKAYEKTTESSQESEVMAKKVGFWAQGRWSSRCTRACSPCHFFLNLVLCLKRETGLSPQDLG